MRIEDLSAEARAQLERLEALGEDDSGINLDDIPETTPEQWATAIRPNQIGLALVVEAETLRWFRDTAGRDYRTEMNAILRRAMLRGRRRLERAAATR